jgi:hypothetical protein
MSRKDDIYLLAYWIRNNPGKLLVHRVKLDRGGYDSRGKYYGVGSPLFEVEADNTGECIYLRAPDRTIAYEMLRKFGYKP